MYVYKPRRGMKRGEENKVRIYLFPGNLLLIKTIKLLIGNVKYKGGIMLAVVL